MMTSRTRRQAGGERSRRPVRTASTVVLIAAAAGTLFGCGGEAPATIGETIVLVENGASNPTVAIAPNGEVLVAWVGEGSQGYDVFLSRLDSDGKQIAEPIRVNDVPGDAHPHEQAPAQVAVGPSGEVFVVWQRKVEAPWLEFGGADLRFARSSDGGRTFEPAITVNDNDPTSPARISFHNIAVAPDGTVYVSWIDARERDRAREMEYRQGGEGEGAAVMPAGHVHGPASSEPGTEIRIARSTDGGITFGPSVVVDHDSCPCCRTALAIGADGSIFTAWRKVFDGGIRDVALAVSSDGGRSFSSARAVHDDEWEFAACPHAGPSLALDTQGRLHTAWYTGAAERQGIWYAVSADGGNTFDAPIPILTDDWVPPSQARLADGGDVVWVAWDDLRQEEREVGVAAITDRKVIPLRVGLPGHAPAIAAANGRGAVAWLDGESVRVLTFRREGADRAVGQEVALRD